MELQKSKDGNVKRRQRVRWRGGFLGGENNRAEVMAVRKRRYVDRIQSLEIWNSRNFCMTGSPSIGPPASRGDGERETEWERCWGWWIFNRTRADSFKKSEMRWSGMETKRWRLNRKRRDLSKVSSEK